MLLEVCCAGEEDALRALAGGAARLELCAEGSLACGGLTPSVELQEAVLVHARARKPAVEVFVLVRAHGRMDFCFSEEEVAQMEQDAASACARGASGIVSGALLREDDDDGNERMQIDWDTTSRLVGAAHPAPLTFHRAVDVAIAAAGEDAFATLEQLADIGVARVLTSGADSGGVAANAATELGRWQRRMDTRDAPSLCILAGGKVRGDNMGVLLDAGLRELHSSARTALSPDTVDPDEVKVMTDNISTWCT